MTGGSFDVKRAGDLSDLQPNLQPAVRSERPHPDGSHLELADFEKSKNEISLRHRHQRRRVRGRLSRRRIPDRRFGMKMIQNKLEKFQLEVLEIGNVEMFDLLVDKTEKLKV